MFCRYCGAPIGESARFCTECGRQQPTEAKPITNRCPVCGTELKEGTAFCYRCGSRTDGAAAAGPTRTSARTGNAAPNTTSSRLRQQETSGFSVSARPEARILGIPVRGKALWIVLAVIAVIVVGLAVFNRFGGDKREPVDGGSAGGSFAAQEPAPEEKNEQHETAPEEAEKPERTGPAGSLKEKLGAASQSAREEEEPAAEEEPAEEAGPAAEPEPASGHDPEAFSASGDATLGDFLWVDRDVLNGARPEGLERLKSGEVSGDWKCYMIDDPEGKFGSLMERLLTANISMNGIETVVTLEWSYAHDGATDEGYDESGQVSVFDGFWTDGGIGAVGPGRIELRDFWYLDGVEYAAGEMMWPDGVPAAVFLVRP